MGIFASNPLSPCAAEFVKLLHKIFNINFVFFRFLPFSFSRFSSTKLLAVGFLLVSPIFLQDLISVSEIFSWISYTRLFPSFLFGCFQRLNNSPNCPNSLVAHQIHFVLPWASESTNRSARRHRQPMRSREATELTNESARCHLPTQTAAISLKLV